jgi:hypothetical protein
MGSLTIPNSITTINSGTFYGCKGLTGALIIPSSVKQLDLLHSLIVVA